MALEAELLDLMVDSISVAPFSTRNGYGEPSFGTATILPARIERTNRKVYGADGTERIATTRIFVPAGTPIDERDRLTLPDGRTPRILSVERGSDERGEHHQVVYT